MKVMLLSMKYVLSLKEYLENDVNLLGETLRCYSLPMLPLHQSCSLDWRFWRKERACLEGLVELERCSWWARVLWARHIACIGAQMKTVLMTISPLSVSWVSDPGACSSSNIIFFCISLSLTVSVFRPLKPEHWAAGPGLRPWLTYPLVSSPSNPSSLIEESSYQSSLETALVRGAPWLPSSNSTFEF